MAERVTSSGVIAKIRSTVNMPDRVYIMSPDRCAVLIEYIDRIEAENKKLRDACSDAVEAIDLSIEPVYHAKIGALHVTLGNAMSVCREALGEPE
jgi:hypothetical protein